MQQNISRKRIEWIDFAKGFAMLCVVLGHTLGGGPRGRILQMLIYSFHMPLYFVLSVLTYQFSQNTTEYFSKLKKSAYHLLLPALILYFIRIFNAIIREPTLLTNGAYYQEKLLELLFASGVSFTFREIKIPSIGMIWFLFALFIGRALFDSLRLFSPKRYLLPLTVIFSSMGVIISYFIWLPFSIDIALAISIFFYVGLRLKEYNFREKALKKLILSGVLWVILATFIIVVTNLNLNIASRRYIFYPLCYITAIAGTLSVCEFSYIFLNHPLSRKLGFLFLIIGRDSLYFFGIHYLDYIWENLWRIPNRGLFSALLRFSEDAIIFFIMIGIISLLNQYKQRRLEIKTVS